VIDIGTVINNMVVESVSFDPPEVWLSCGHGHRVWATPKLLESGPVKCKECETDQSVRMKSAQIMRDVLDDLAAGNF
jgi:hypothetical protein